jgi:hypothetical protein
MQRSLLSVAFVLLLASLPVSAQHGGGHASGGGHGGFALHGGFASHASSPAFSGARSGSSFAGHSFARGSVARPSFSTRGFNRGFGRSRAGVRFRTGIGSNCYYYGFGCVGAYGYPWGYGGAYDPYWDSDSSFDYGQQYQTGLANEMNQQSLDQQQMRQQADQDLYAGSAPPPPRERSEHSELNEAAPATVLVFRDEHKQEVHNYAIIGQTLWNFNPQHTQKIPLSDLDIPATAKENDDRGVDFHVPGAQESQ